MRASSFVRINQGQSRILAPLVAIESPEILVLKGPKQLRLIQEIAGPQKVEEYRATCDGDLVMDRKSHWLYLRRACRVETPDLLLNADRVNIRLGPDNKAMESMLALGQVDTLRSADHHRLTGDRLFYKFGELSDLRVYGSPVAVADSGRTHATQEKILVYDRLTRSGQKVRYTEMLGGSDGVCIEIEERASDRPPPRILRADGAPRDPNAPKRP